MKNCYYIAYGSNLSVEQMAIRCPNARPVGTATLKDWQLLFKIHATIAPKKGHEVPVVVWEIEREDERKLDRYEGFPVYYHKRFLPVEMRSFATRRRRKITAMVYIMNDVRPITPPMEGYYNAIDEGYERFHLDRNILRDAFNESVYIYALENRMI